MPQVPEGSPLSYLEAASRSNLTVVFLTGFAGTDRLFACIPPPPSFTPGSHAFALTTRTTEQATGFATRAREANWTVIFMEEVFRFPDKPEWMRWNLLMKQVRAPALVTELSVQAVVLSSCFPRNSKRRSETDT